MNTGIHRARPDDAAAITELRRDVVAWLATRGTDQWQPVAMQTQAAPPTSGRTLAAAISRGEVWITTLGASIVGTFTLDSYADPDFWSVTESSEPALYIHRMMVARQISGRGIGSQMLAFAQREAAVSDLQRLRLDAWRTNRALHDYYLGQGFKHLRTVERLGRGSGALFEKSVPPTA